MSLKKEAFRRRSLQNEGKSSYILTTIYIECSLCT